MGACLSPPRVNYCTSFAERRTALWPRSRDLLPHETEVAAFRLAQECFHNIAKHSGASTVNLSLHCTDGLLRLDVDDDGVGFDLKVAQEKRSSFGLTGMRERVALLGGKLTILSAPRRGTRISVELPVKTKHRRGPLTHLRESA